MDKPYYQNELVTIYHGDCLDILPELGPVDLVLTDPPYGINWDTNYSRFSKGEKDKDQVCNDNKPFNPMPFLKYNNVILWGANHYCDKLPYGSWLLWDKRNADGTSFLSDGEIAWWNHGRGVYIKSISGQRHRAISNGLHPTQKPVELMMWCMEKSKAVGVVLDPYLGSGTTAIACERLKRRWIGIEIEEKYCEIAAKRIEQERKQLKLF